MSFSILNLFHRFVKFDKFLFYHYFNFVIQVCILYRCIEIYVHVVILDGTKVVNVYLYSIKTSPVFQNNLTNLIDQKWKKTSLNSLLAILIQQAKPQNNSQFLFNRSDC